MTMVGRLAIPPSTPTNSLAPPINMAMTGAEGIAVPIENDRSFLPNETVFPEWPVSGVLLKSWMEPPVSKFKA